MLLAFSKQRPGQPPTKNGPALGVSSAKAEKCKPPREMLIRIITRTTIISTADTQCLLRSRDDSRHFPHGNSLTTTCEVDVIG